MSENQPFSADGANAFEAYCGREDLINITVPGGLQITEIGESAFEGCINLQTAEIFADIEKIEFGAFQGCKNLRSVIIHGSSLKHIHAYAFQGCASLELTLPDSVSEIDENAFKDVKCLFYKGAAAGAPWGAIAYNTKPKTETQLNNTEPAEAGSPDAQIKTAPQPEASPAPAEGVKDKFNSFVSSAAGYIRENTQKDKLRENAASVRDKVSDLVSGAAGYIRENTQKEKLRENAESVKNKVSDLVSGAAGYIRENTQKDKLRENAASVKNKVSGLVSGATDYIRENAQKEKLRESAESVKNKVSGFFSKYMKKK